MYVWIVPDIISSAVDRPFLYKVPDELIGAAALGKIVKVPFGRGSVPKKGYIIGLDEKIEEGDRRLNGKKPDQMRVKELLSIEDEAGELTEKNIELASFIKRRYGSTMASAIRTVFVKDKKTVGRKKRTAVLKADRSKLLSYIEFNKRKNNKARLRLSEALLSNESIDYRIITKELKISAAVVRKLKEDGILEIVENDHEKKTVSKAEFGSTFVLTPEQEEVVQGVLRYSEERMQDSLPAISLIHGVTGSGKTNVYMELISRVITEGKKAIMLIPEISLTMQNIMRFSARFKDRVSFIHSRLSKSEKWERFDMASKGEIDIMIGPRSALFTPFDDIGIIIIDEEHESSYSSDRMPKYNAVEVAVKLADMHKAMLVLGSATPSVESYYKALNKEYGLFELKERYGSAGLPKVHIVDMKKELLAGNRTMFSHKLLAAIKDRLDKKEQVMLFLNRRGYFGFNSCRACGTVIQCPHCDVSLSLHKDGKLKCHYCGYERSRYTNCPKCGSEYIGSMNAGTQHIEDQLKVIFPKIRILRMDADTTTGKYDTDSIIESFLEGEADILIGTQMIVKGHDFKKVSLMGILLADMSLNLSSYKAAERSFQLLMQAAGRAGRSDLAGEVIMQTYRPEHFCIEEAAKQNYPGFYEEEIKFRKLLGYPPFFYMIHLNLQCKEEEYLIKAAEYMRHYLDIASRKSRVEVIGPGIPVIPKLNDFYRRSIYLKHPSMEVLLKLRDEIEEYISVNRGYDTMLIDFDYTLN